MARRHTITYYNIAIIFNQLFILKCVYDRNTHSYRGKVRIGLNLLQHTSNQSQVKTRIFSQKKRDQEPVGDPVNRYCVTFMHKNLLFCH